LHGFLASDDSGKIMVGNGTRSRIGIAGYLGAPSAGRAATAGSCRLAWITAASVFQSAAPSIFETSSRPSLWLMVTALPASESRRVCAMAFASRKSRMSFVLCSGANQACQVVALLTRSLGQRKALKA